MKFRIHGMFLSLFFALAVGFSFSIEASAHDYLRSDGQRTYMHSEDIDVSAEMVENAADADKEEYMKKFVRHVATHLDLIQKDTTLDEEARQEQSREVIVFGRKAKEAGPFNNGVDIYAMGVTPRGAITNHGLHGNLLGYRYDSSQEPLTTLLGDTVPLLSDTVDPVCATYDDGNRVACAVKQPTLAGVITTITGFHHAEERPDFVQDIDCRDFTLTPTAQQLENAPSDMNLQQYVKGIIQITGNVIAKTVSEVSMDDPTLINDPDRFELELGARMFEKFPCFREQPDLRYGSVYAFIMDPLRGVAFMSGNDFTRNGLSVSLNDPNPPSYDGEGNIEPNVLTAIHRTLTKTPPPNPIPTDSDGFVDVKDGNSGFFTYHWAHPINKELNTTDYLERCAVPGRALKRSYIEVANVAPAFSPEPFLLVFGSGFYHDQEEEDIMPDDGSNLCPVPVTETEDGDDGCAIAAADNAPQIALFNLFLIASVLFSAVLLRRRV